MATSNARTFESIHKWVLKGSLNYYPPMIPITFISEISSASNWVHQLAKWMPKCMHVFDQNFTQIKWKPLINIPDLKTLMKSNTIPPKTEK